MLSELRYKVNITMGVENRNALPTVVGDSWMYTPIPPTPVASFEGNARQTAALLRSLADEIYPADQSEAAND